MALPASGELGGNTTTQAQFKQKIEDLRDVVYAIENRLQIIMKKPSKEVLFTKTAPAEFTIPTGFKILVGSTPIEVVTTTTLSLDTN